MNTLLPDNVQIALIGLVSGVALKILDSLLSANNKKTDESGEMRKELREALRDKEVEADKAQVHCEAEKEELRKQVDYWRDKFYQELIAQTRGRDQ